MDPIQELAEIEAIKQLKGRYQRGVDTKDWDLLASTFAPDARSVDEAADIIPVLIDKGLNEAMKELHTRHE